MGKPNSRRAKGRPNSTEPGVGRDAIITATRALLTDHSHAKLSLRELARALNVDPGLIRYYFGNKEGLYAEVVQEVLEESRRRHQKVLHSSLPPDEKLRRRIAIYLDIITENPFLHSLFLDVVMHGKEPDAAQYRHQAVARGYLEVRQLLASSGAAIAGQPIDARFLHIAIIGMCEFYVAAQPMVRELFGGQAPSRGLRARYGRFLIALLTHGIEFKGPPPARLYARGARRGTKSRPRLPA
jgi:AcrR family transcriptional regulator